MITTTATLEQSPSVRCEICGKQARGGVLINGRGECHVRPGDRPLLLAMIGDAPERTEPLPPLTAADPMDPRRGTHPGAMRILGEIKSRARDGDTRFRQATGEAVKAVFDAKGQTFGVDSSPWQKEADGSRWKEQEALGAPSIPPAHGADPLFAGTKPPLRGPRMVSRHEGTRTG